MFVSTLTLEESSLVNQICSRALEQCQGPTQAPSTLALIDCANVNIMGVVPLVHYRLGFSFHSLFVCLFRSSKVLLYQ